MQEPTPPARGGPLVQSSLARPISETRAFCSLSALSTSRRQWPLASRTSCLPSRDCGASASRTESSSLGASRITHPRLTGILGASIAPSFLGRPQHKTKMLNAPHRATATRETLWGVSRAWSGDPLLGAALCRPAAMLPWIPQRPEGPGQYRPGQQIVPWPVSIDSLQGSDAEKTPLKNTRASFRGSVGFHTREADLAAGGCRLSSLTWPSTFQVSATQETLREPPRRGRTAAPPLALGPWASTNGRSKAAKACTRKRLYSRLDGS